MIKSNVIRYQHYDHVIVSHTAKLHGNIETGKGMVSYVSHLTKEERKAIETDSAMVFVYIPDRYFRIFLILSETRTYPNGYFDKAGNELPGIPKTNRRWIFRPALEDELKYRLWCEYTKNDMRNAAIHKLKKSTEYWRLDALDVMETCFDLGIPPMGVEILRNPYAKVNPTGEISDWEFILEEQSHEGWEKYWAWIDEKENRKRSL